MAQNEIVGHLQWSGSDSSAIISETTLIDVAGKSKSEVDDKPPRTHLHNYVNMKKIQMEQGKLAVLERDNRVLMERIAKIMRSKGAVDNWNTRYLRSFNSAKRNKENVRITLENQAIYKKIQESKPHYDHKKWEDEWKVTRKLLSHTTSYHSAVKGRKIG